MLGGALPGRTSAINCFAAVAARLAWAQGLFFWMDALVKVR